MGIELPPELAEVAAAAGVAWPEADEEAMAGAARAWRDAAADLTTVTADADNTARAALNSVQGETGAAAGRHWSTFVEPDSGHLTSAVRGMNAAADRLEHAARQVGAAKVEIVRNLVSLAQNAAAAQSAAAAGHPMAMAGLDTAIRGTSANVANIESSLVAAVQPGSGVDVAAVVPPVNASPGVHAPTGLVEETVGRATAAAENVPGQVQDAVGAQAGPAAVAHDVAGTGPVPETGPVHAVTGNPDITGPVAIGLGQEIAPDNTPTPPRGITGQAGFDTGPGAAGPSAPGTLPPSASSIAGVPGTGGQQAGGPNLGAGPAVGPVAGAAAAGTGPAVRGVDRAFMRPADAAPQAAQAAQPAMGRGAGVPAQPGPGGGSPATGQPPAKPGAGQVGGQPVVSQPNAAKPGVGQMGGQPVASQAGPGQPGAPGIGQGQSPVGGQPGGHPAGQSGTAQPGQAAQAEQPAPGQPVYRERDEVLALFWVHMFPIGHMPVAMDRPGRQVPPPPVELDYAAGLRFEPGDHPRAGLVDSARRRAELRDGVSPVEPSVPLGRDEVTALTEGHDPLGGEHERDWDRRYQVRFGSVTAEGIRPEGLEFAWPPCEQYPEGGSAPGEAEVLGPGTEFDRFGPADGRVFAPAGTAFAQRSLPPAHLDLGYRRYRVLRPLPVWRAVSAAWFAQPGGGVRYRTTHSAIELVALGYLADITREEP